MRVSTFVLVMCAIGTCETLKAWKVPSELYSTRLVRINATQFFELGFKFKYAASNLLIAEYNNYGMMTHQTSIDTELDGSVVQASLADPGLLVMTAEKSAGMCTPTVIRLDDSLKLIWQRTYSEISVCNTDGNAFVRTRHNTTVVAGWHRNASFVLFEIGLNGEVVWQNDTGVHFGENSQKAILVSSAEETDDIMYAENELVEFNETINLSLNVYSINSAHKQRKSLTIVKARAEFALRTDVDIQAGEGSRYFISESA